MTSKNQMFLDVMVAIPYVLIGMVEAPGRGPGWDRIRCPFFSTLVSHLPVLKKSSATHPLGPGPTCRGLCEQFPMTFQNLAKITLEDLRRPLFDLEVLSSEDFRHPNPAILIPEYSG